MRPETIAAAGANKGRALVPCWCKHWTSVWRPTTNSAQSRLLHDPAAADLVSNNCQAYI